MQSELRDGFIVVGAENQSDALGVVAAAELVVDGVEVERHLARELRLELADLQVDDDESAQLVVVEEQIEEELLPADLQRLLATVLREPNAEFTEEPRDLPHRSVFQFALAGVLGDVDEVEHVRVLGHGQGRSAFDFAERAGVIGGGRAIAQVQLEIDLSSELTARPGFSTALAAYHA